MDTVGQLDAILDLFERLGIDVRREQLGGAGGSLCRIHGKQIVFLDLDADVATQVDRCLDALSGIPGVDTVYIPPELRERLDERRRTQA